MANKHSKKIIQEAVKAAIRGDIVAEGPINFARSVGSGIKGAGQGVYGNFQANRAKSYMDQLAKKTTKQFQKLSPKAQKQADSMKRSSNPAVKQTGERITDEIADTGERVKALQQDIESSFPSAVGQNSPQGMNRSPQAQAPQSQSEPPPMPAGVQVSAPQRAKLAGGSPTPPQMSSPLHPNQPKPTPPQMPAAAPSTPQMSAPGNAGMPKPYPAAPPGDAMSKPASDPWDRTQKMAQPPGSKTNQQSGLKATIGDMIAQKPTSQQAPRSGRQAITPPAPAPKTEKDSPKLDLSSIGADSKEFSKINQAANDKHPAALELVKAMQWGDKQAASTHLEKLRKSGFKSASIPPTRQGAAKTDSNTQPGTRPMKKQSDTIPPEQTADTQAIPGFNQTDTGPGPALPAKSSAQVYTPPSPSQAKPQAYTPPSPDVLQPGEPIIPLTQKKGQKSKKKTAAKESEDPIMSMADFMTKADEKTAKRSRKKSKKGKVLIHDVDDGAKSDDKFVSRSERRNEGY